MQTANVMSGSAEISSTALQMLQHHLGKAHTAYRTMDTATASQAYAVAAIFSADGEPWGLAHKPDFNIPTEHGDQKISDLVGRWTETLDGVTVTGFDFLADPDHDLFTAMERGPYKQVVFPGCTNADSLKTSCAKVAGRVLVIMALKKHIIMLEGGDSTTLHDWVAAGAELSELSGLERSELFSIVQDDLWGSIDKSRCCPSTGGRPSKSKIAGQLRQLSSKEGLLPKTYKVLVAVQQKRNKLSATAIKAAFEQVCKEDEALAASMHKKTAKRKRRAKKKKARLTGLQSETESEEPDSEQTPTAVAAAAGAGSSGSDQPDAVAAVAAAVGAGSSGPEQTDAAAATAKAAVPGSDQPDVVAATAEAAVPGSDQPDAAAATAKAAAPGSDQPDAAAATAKAAVPGSDQPDAVAATTKAAVPGSDQPPDAVVTDQSQHVDQAYSGCFDSDGGGFEGAALLANVLVPAAAEATPGSETSASQQQVARRGSAAISADSCAADHIAVVFRQLAKEQWAAFDVVRFYKGVAWPTMLAIGRCWVKAESSQSSMPVSAEDWSCMLQAIQKAAYSLIRFAHRIRDMHTCLTGNFSAIAANKKAFQCVQEMVSLVQQINQQMTKESGRAACRVECCELYSHTVASTELSLCLSRVFSDLFSSLSYEAEYPMGHYHDATAVDRVIALADLARTGLEQFKDAQAQQSNLYTAMATVFDGSLHPVWLEVTKASTMDEQFEPKQTATHSGQAKAEENSHLNGLTTEEFIHGGSQVMELASATSEADYGSLNSGMQLAGQPSVNPEDILSMSQMERENDTGSHKAGRSMAEAGVGQEAHTPQPRDSPRGHKRAHSEVAARSRQGIYRRADDIELRVDDCPICYKEKALVTWGCEGGTRHPICKECKATCEKLKSICPVCNGEAEPNVIVPHPMQRRTGLKGANGYAGLDDDDSDDYSEYTPVPTYRRSMTGRRTPRDAAGLDEHNADTTRMEMDVSDDRGNDSF